MVTQKKSRLNKVKVGSPVISFLIYVFIGLVALVTLAPFIYIVSASISDPMEVMGGNVWFFPKGFSLKSYERVLNSTAVWHAFANSIFFTVSITFVNVINSMMAGYALSKPGLVFRKTIILFILIPMYFSGGLIPSFINMSLLGLYNTVFSIILPSAISIWNIILARTYISGVPPALREAAIIDGAGEFKVFSAIILPMCKPIIAVLALYTAMATWNQWFNFIIYMPALVDWHPLQVFLTKVLIWGSANATISTDSTDPSYLKNAMLLAAVASQLKYSVMVVATVPIVAVYPFAQKYFVQGAVLGSLKE